MSGSVGTPTRMSVLYSPRRWEELYLDGDAWTAQGDGLAQPLDPARVRAAFGDEPFRRLARFAEEGRDAFRPRPVRLIGRRPLKALTSAGWTIEHDGDDSATLTSGSLRIALDIDETGWFRLTYRDGAALLGSGRGADLGAVEEAAVELGVSGRRPSETSGSLYWSNAEELGE